MFSPLIKYIAAFLHIQPHVSEKDDLIIWNNLPDGEEPKAKTVLTALGSADSYAGARVFEPNACLTRNMQIAQDIAWDLMIVVSLPELDFKAQDTVKWHRVVLDRNSAIVLRNQLDEALSEYHVADKRLGSMFDNLSSLEDGSSSED